MTAKKTASTSARKSNRKAATPPPSVDVMQWLLQREVWGLVLTAIGAVTVISLLSHGQGQLSRAWSLMLRQTFGVGAYAIALLLLASGVLVLLWNVVQDRFTPRWQTVIGAELFFFAVLGLLHVTSGEPPLELARDGRRGGYLGWAIYQVFVPALGRPVSVLLLAILVMATALLTTGISWRTVAWQTRWAVSQAALWVRTQLARRRALASARPAPTIGEPGFLRPRAPAPSAPAPRSAPPAPKPSKASRAKPREAPIASVPTAAGLPPLDLLTPEEPGTSDEADARLKAQLIEDTLEAFGIPARVAEWHRGPVVTQFGVEPGYIERPDRDGNMRRFKVRVSKILSLTNDLALALAAAQIRIEAPVPGRALVGIEVPNETKAVVGLRGVLESETFHKTRGLLRIALGRGVSGEAVVSNLAAMPHLLLAGATGSGKSVCLNAIIASLLFFNTPDQLKLLLIDPKRVEMTKYNGIPHLLAPVVVDIEKVIVALRWVTREMDRRYARFAEVGGVPISWSVVALLLSLIVLAGLLYLLFQRTKLGLMLRAAASNPASARLVGINSSNMLMLGWALAAGLGAVAGVLAAADRGSVNPGLMAVVLVYAFAAAALGGFDSPIGAVVGAMIVAIAEAMTIGYVKALSTIELVVPFGLILLVLLVRPTGLFGRKVVERV